MKLTIEFDSPEDLVEILEKMRATVEPVVEATAEIPVPKPGPVELKPSKPQWTTIDDIEDDGDMTVRLAPKELPQKKKKAYRKLKKEPSARIPVNKAIAESKTVTVKADAELKLVPKEPKKEKINTTALFSTLVQQDVQSARALLQRHGLTRFSEAKGEVLQSLVMEAMKIVGPAIH